MFYIYKVMPCIYVTCIRSFEIDCADLSRPTPGLGLEMPSGIRVDTNCFSNRVQPYNSCSTFHATLFFRSLRYRAIALPPPPPYGEYKI